MPDWSGRAVFRLPCVPGRTHLLTGEDRMSTSSPALHGSAQSELNREARIGGHGTCVARDIPQIDLSDYDSRKSVITDALWDAATQVGFFRSSITALTRRTWMPPLPLRAGSLTCRWMKRRITPVVRGPTWAGNTARRSAHPPGHRITRNPTRSPCHRWAVTYGPTKAYCPDFRPACSVSSTRTGNWG